jgi:uncharacterized protein YjbJ (UPF0337 family)
LQVRAPEARTAVEISAAKKDQQMNWDTVAGNWKQFKGDVQAQWGRLTDDQFDVIAGRRTELAGKIQEIYGLTKDEAELQIKRFEDRKKEDPTIHT